MAIKIRSKLKTREVILPLGIIINGERYTTCVVECLDGKTEEMVSERRVKNNGSKIITEVLANKIKRVGDIDYPNGVGESIARNMFVGDRDTCLFAIRSLMDENIEVEARCPSCGEKMYTDINVNTLLDEIAIWDDCDIADLGIIPFELKDGLTIENTETGEIKDCKKGKLKLINGKAEEGVFQNRNNAGAANTLLLSASIIELENIRKVDASVVRAFTKNDRDYIASLIADNHYGPKMIGNTECPNCGEEINYNFKLTDFFTVTKHS